MHEPNLLEAVMVVFKNYNYQTSGANFCLLPCPHMTHSASCHLKHIIQGIQSEYETTINIE